jgi:hypothetical protein
MPTIPSDERTELIGALHQVTGFAEGLIALTRQLLESLEGGRERPSEQDVSEMRAGLERWQAAIDGVRKRVASLTTEAAERGCSSDRAAKRL